MIELPFPIKRVAISFIPIPAVYALGVYLYPMDANINIIESIFLFFLKLYNVVTANIFQIILSGILVLSLVLTYKSLKKDTTLHRSNFMHNFNDYRVKDPSISKIRELVYGYDEHDLITVSRIKKLTLVEKLNFINYLEEVYCLYQSGLMDFDTAYNFFGAFILEVYNLDDFWIGYEKKNTIYKKHYTHKKNEIYIQNDNRVIIFERLVELMENKDEKLKSDKAKKKFLKNRSLFSWR